MTGLFGTVADPRTCQHPDSALKIERASVRPVPWQVHCKDCKLTWYCQPVGPGHRP